MRTIFASAFCAASLLANPYFDPDPGDVGMGVLTVWPTARSTALAGAMTGLADEVDATFFNPAGLAFQTTAKADVTHANWLPDLYPGMYYESAAGGAPVRFPFLNGRDAFVAGSAAYMAVGETDVVDEHGEFIGRFTAWRACLGLHSGVQLSQKVGLGISAKLTRSEHASDYWMRWAEFSPGIGLEFGGTATAVAFDAGAFYKPAPSLSIGLSVASLGPDISYRLDDLGGSHDYKALLPRTARLGLCWTALEGHDFSLHVMPELDKLLIGMFYDTTGTKTLGRQLNEEWRDARKALGVEIAAFRLVALRLGYFEDLTNQLGGLAFEKEGQTYHYGISDALNRSGLGQLKSIGLCWGFGVGYRDYFRIDVSSDAAIYDFPTRNLKFSLAVNDIAGSIRELGRTHKPRKEYP